MTVLRASSIPEVLAALAALPGALPLAGGTDLLVAVNAGTVLPAHLVTLRRVDELRGVSTTAAGTRFGALTTYAELQASGTPLLRSVAAAVGSPASRNTGTLGGALGTSSATGDALTALMAAGAQVEVAGPGGVRTVDVHELTKDRRELVTAVHVPAPAGPQTYLKLAQRQAAVGATVACALTVDGAAHTVRIALAGVGAKPQRAQTAEAFVRDEVSWLDGLPVVDEAVLARFAQLTVAVLAPLAHARASSAYRRHAAGVLARRALARVSAQGAAASMAVTA